MSGVRNEYLPQANEGPATDRSKRREEMPHSHVSEAALLGCLLAPSSSTFNQSEVLAAVVEQFMGEQPLYDLRHQVIWAVIQHLNGTGTAIDVTTVYQKLVDDQQLAAVGGIEYLSGLPDQCVPANWQHYLEGIWEKHLARQLIQQSSQIVSSVLDINGVNETLLGQLVTLHEEFQRKAQRGAVTPQHLKPVSAFGEEAYAHFFGAINDKAPGFEFFVPFPMNTRMREATLLFGDDGSGKSTVLSYWMLHLLQHEGNKLVLASFEMPPAVSLWIMASQLLGRKAFTDTEANRVTIARAIAWLNARVTFYDFQGIANWREVRDTFRYAAEKQGANLFTIDNAMRMGIADDDYAQQALAAATFHQFAEDHNAHVVIVLHENKGDGKGKSKIRGSKLWSANMNNVLNVKRNADKGEKIGREDFVIEFEKSKEKPDLAAIAEAERKKTYLKEEWDTEIVLHKQRYPGTRQNASKRIWFDPNSFQLRAGYGEEAVNWLRRWKGGV